MRRRAAAFLIATLVAAIPATSIATAAHHGAGLTIAVTPASGAPTTRFVISFRTPDRTGRVGALDRRDQISLSGPTGQAGCLPSVLRTLPRAAAHVRVVTPLDPARLGGDWCVGAYRGRIDEIEGPVCVKRRPCPKIATRLTQLGRFAFQVKRIPSDTTPPTFAGLQSAFACTPGPQRPGETTPFRLTWTAASDSVTPSSQIVYDVFMATAAGGEDFAHPTWTTAPGVTEFETPGLASHGTFYFVVRARDQAGNEDGNLVERRGIDPCL